MYNRNAHEMTRPHNSQHSCVKMIKVGMLTP